jgi:hypothetical protein
VILLSAQGERFSQKIATELAALDRIVLICGRYEGVDERVADFLADRELSIGDYVLSGGEMAAAVIIEAVTRLVAGCSWATKRRRGRSRLRASRAEAEAGCGFDLRFGRIARLSALHAARGFLRDERAGSFAQRQSRRNSPLAPGTGFEENAAKPPGFAGGREAQRGRRRTACQDQGSDPNEPAKVTLRWQLSRPG